MQVKIQGNTYPVREALKAIGAKWDADAKSWTITEKRAQEARKIVAAAPAPVVTSGKCLKCKGTVKPPYQVCYACKNRGKCLNCGAELDQWEKSHGVKRCVDCRDGGSSAHGGQSYYDRRGNFVLGDDD